LTGYELDTATEPVVNAEVQPIASGSKRRRADTLEPTSDRMVKKPGPVIYTAQQLRKAKADGILAIANDAKLWIRYRIVTKNPHPSTSERNEHATIEFTKMTEDHIRRGMMTTAGECSLKNSVAIVNMVTMTVLDLQLNGSVKLGVLNMVTHH
jgi:hypothetical protein